MRRMYRLRAFSGVTAEVVAVLLVWLSADEALADWQEGALLFTAAVFHSASSYYLARMFWQSLPRRYKLPPRRSLGLLFTFLWILPVFGALGVLWSITRALKRPRTRSAKNVKIIVLPELPFSPPVIFPVPPYSQGALRQIVHFAERSLKRLKAVMATRHMAPREAMEVWSKATRDPIDDVRLLAYAMKDAHEKRLTDRVLALTEALPHLPPRAQNACRKTIAALCWELVYHKLVQGAVRQHWLKNARAQMEAVLTLPSIPRRDVPSASVSAPVGTASEASLASSKHERSEASSLSGGGNADSWLLYGRILLESGEDVLARKAFVNAQIHGADQQQLLPWFAEIAFRERKFTEAKRCLSALARVGEKGRELALVRAWWNK
ncbi:hypothetical protein SAMN05216412_10945 [Nitrosospira multiformis]|uniref:Protein PelE n=1 Tax=Nitrosospira multiformis TaxID=1231 RepID=A0A1I0FJ71_9PROT|nr:protein PelE [Nitrosospira multiformis]SET58397.1 hypothetical protein SAMN05216412_10945 [Nitrosospira multiformis]